MQTKEFYVFSVNKNHIAIKKSNMKPVVLKEL